MLAIGGGAALGFMAVWFLVGGKKVPAPRSPVAPPDRSGAVFEGRYVDKGVDVPHAPVPGWRATLGVGEAASRAQVDAAYRTLCGQYEPAALERMAPELRAIAQTRRAQIDAAYRQALDEQGEGA